MSDAQTKSGDCDPALTRLVEEVLGLHAQATQGWDESGVRIPNAASLAIGTLKKVCDEIQAGQGGGIIDIYKVATSVIQQLGNISRAQDFITGLRKSLELPCKF